MLKDNSKAIYAIYDAFPESNLASAIALLEALDSLVVADTRSIGGQVVSVELANKIDELVRNERIVSAATTLRRETGISLKAAAVATAAHVHTLGIHRLCGHINCPVRLY